MAELRVGDRAYQIHRLDRDATRLPYTLRILLENLSPAFIRVNSSLGSAAPLHVVILPVLFEGEVKAVLELAAKQAGWGKPLAQGRSRGIAVHESFNTFVAQVAEVSRRKDGSLRLERVVCAVDCGVAVNPNIIAMQMESGIGYGLSAALMGAITLKDGRVEQSNFHDYPVLRINQMPRVEVHIVPSKEKPSGVGEPATPVIAPALANAILALGGKPVRALPLSAQGITFS